MANEIKNNVCKNRLASQAQTYWITGRIARQYDMSFDKAFTLTEAGKKNHYDPQISNRIRQRLGNSSSSSVPLRSA